MSLHSLIFDKNISFQLKDRSSHLEVFCKKGVLRNFAKFTGKHLCQRLFFNKVAGRLAPLLKKSLWHRCFLVNFEKFLRTSFLTEHLRWLLQKRKTYFHHCTKNEVFHWGFLHFLCSACIITCHIHQVQARTTH